MPSEGWLCCKKGERKLISSLHLVHGFKEDAETQLTENPCPEDYEVRRVLVFWDNEEEYQKWGPVAGLGLAPLQEHILTYIKEDGPLLAQEIAKRLGQSMEVTSRLIDSLIMKGFLGRNEKNFF